MKKVIITGASGPLGSKLCKKLANEGIMVLAIVRMGSNRKEALVNVKNIEIEEVNIEDIELVYFDNWKDADVCFHFAWTHTGDEKRNDPVEQANNIIYTLKTAEFAKRHGCKVFIGAGSQAEYGKMSGKVDEETETSPDTLYGITKLAAGRLAIEYCEQNGMRCNWIRIFAVYGPEENDYILTAYVIKTLLKREKPILTPCQQVWDYLYIDDALCAIQLIAEKASQSGVYCLGSGSPKTVKEYVEKIRDTINPELELGIGEKEYSANQIMHLEADISKINHDVGFVPQIPFEVGIKNTIEWYETNKL